MDLRSGKSTAMEAEEGTFSQQETSSEEGQQETLCLADLLKHMNTMMQNNAKLMQKNMQDNTTQLETNMQDNITKLERNVQDNITQLEKNMHDNTTKMEKNMQDNTALLERKMEETLREIRNDVARGQERIEEAYERVKRVETEVDTKMAQTMAQVEEAKTELKQEVKAQVESVKAEVNPMKERLARLEERRPERIQVTMHPSMFRGGDSDLKFFGDRRMHAVVYLKTLSERLEDARDRAEFKKIIRPTMKGSAELWYDMVEEKLDTIDDFTNAFLDYFWGEQAQSKVRENLYTGRFDESFGSSREEYAMKKMAVARYLEPQLNEADIVKYIARHFKEEIRDVVAIQGINEVGKLLHYLRRVDDIKPVRRNRFPRQGNNEGRENQRYDGGRWNWEPARNQPGNLQKNRNEGVQNNGTGRLERERGDARNGYQRRDQQNTQAGPGQPRYQNQGNGGQRYYQDRSYNNDRQYQNDRAYNDRRYQDRSYDNNRQYQQYQPARQSYGQDYNCNTIQVNKTPETGATPRVRQETQEYPRSRNGDEPKPNATPTEATPARQDF